LRKLILFAMGSLSEVNGWEESLDEEEMAEENRLGPTGEAGGEMQSLEEVLGGGEQLG